MSLAGRVGRRSALRGALALGAFAALGSGVAACSGDPAGAAPTEGVIHGADASGGRRWRLAVPDGRASRGLVVALHGLGGDADAAFDLGYADSVAATGLALVSVDGGESYWHRRRDGTDTGAMVRERLVPLALARCGLPASARVGLLGWSMGGFGALLLATELGAARVNGVVAASAALWRSAGETPPVAYDDRADFDEHSVFGRVRRLSGIPVRLDCGLSDPFIAANRALAQRLTNAETHFEPGGHEDDWWRAQAPAEMAWLAARA